MESEVVPDSPPSLLWLLQLTVKMLLTYIRM